MTRLHVIRHGETANGLDLSIVGGRHLHDQLTRRGRRQAHDRGLWIIENDLEVDFAVASHADRAQQTGAIVLLSADLTLQLETNEQLVEMSQGIYEGKDRSEAYTPENLEEIARLGLDFKFPGGESMREVGERMLEAFRRIALEHPDQAGLLFSHSTAIRCAAGLLLGMTNYEIFNTPCDHLSLTTFEVEGDNISVGEIAERLPAVSGTLA